MVKIRLTRTGKRHEPHYRIVATDSRVKRDGKYLERIGYYNPRTKPPTLDYDKNILQKWLDNGAQMTDTVHDIFVREGIVKKSPKREARIKKMIEASKKRASESDSDAKATEASKAQKKPAGDKPSDDRKDQKSEEKKDSTKKKDTPKEPKAEEPKKDDADTKKEE